MTRPRYESQKDLDHEAQVCSLLATSWNCSFQKLPISYHLDYAAIRAGGIQAFIEIKRRHNTISKYPTIFIALSKLNTAHTLLESTGKGSMLVIQYDDCLAYTSLLAQPCSLTFEGRSDRGDSADQEPMAHYATSELTRIDTPPTVSVD